ncbi:hypothetical protein GCM10009748_19520 [Agromyces lapidis]
MVAGAGSDAPHRMHWVGRIRRIVVFCRILMLRRCAKPPCFVTDETANASICKRRGTIREDLKRGSVRHAEIADGMRWAVAFEARSSGLGAGGVSATPPELAKPIASRSPVANLQRATPRWPVAK